MCQYSQVSWANQLENLYKKIVYFNCLLLGKALRHDVSSRNFSSEPTNKLDSLFITLTDQIIRIHSSKSKIQALTQVILSYSPEHLF